MNAVERKSAKLTWDELDRCSYHRHDWGIAARLAIEALFASKRFEMELVKKLGERAGADEDCVLAAISLLQWPLTWGIDRRDGHVLGYQDGLGRACALWLARVPAAPVSIGR